MSLPTLGTLTFADHTGSGDADADTAGSGSDSDLGSDFGSGSESGPESDAVSEFDPDGGNAWTALVAGDCIYKGGFDEPFAPIAGDVADADLGLVNLEAPIRGDGEPIPKTGPAHASTPETPALLAEAGFDAATLANNHVMDYGPEGLAATEAACADAGLATVGTGQNVEDALTPLETTVGGVSVAVVNLCEREFGVAADGRPGTAWISHPSAERLVADAAASNDVTIVIAHGGVEYVPIPPTHLQTRLRAFVEAGADAVVGHHPHVPQGWGTHEGAPICYSVGNLLFDSKRSKTRWGAPVELRFDGDRLREVAVRGTELRDGAVRPLEECRDPEDCRRYLERSAAVIADRDRLIPHWQELAVRIFEHRYTGWLRTGTASGLGQILTDPRAALGDGAFDPEERRTELLTLLNVVRNESHRDVVETTLGVKTDDVPDRRTPAVEREVRDLLVWTEDERVYDRPSGVRRAVKSLVGLFR